MSRFIQTEINKNKEPKKEKPLPKPGSYTIKNLENAKDVKIVRGS